MKDRLPKPGKQKCVSRYVSYTHGGNFGVTKAVSDLLWVAMDRIGLDAGDPHKFARWSPNPRKALPGESTPEKVMILTEGPR